MENLFEAHVKYKKFPFYWTTNSIFQIYIERSLKNGIVSKYSFIESSSHHFALVVC